MRQVPPSSGALETASKDSLLQRIATALGVSCDAFYVLPEQHVFHVAADGTRWLLASAVPGSPTIHRLPPLADDQSHEGEGVTAFLIRNLERPEGQALAALIDRVLTMHLHLDMRG